MQKNRISQKYSQTQKQNLRLSQSMKQSLSFLSVPLYELEEKIVKIAEINPFVDIEYCYTNSNEIPEDYMDPGKLSLSETIFSQLRTNHGNMNFQVVSEILDQCDSNGYYKGNMYYLARKYNLTIKEIQSIRFAIMECDPCGIGAINLKECLLAQVEGDKEENALLRKTIESGLPYLAEGNIQKLKDLLQINDQEIKKCIQIIRSMNPRPASQFVNDSAKWIRPELRIEESTEGFEVMPIRYFQLRINRLKGHDLSKEDRKVISSYYSEAQNLELHLFKREETLLTCFKEVVSIQKRYLSGESEREICTLGDIAQKVNRNVSTISRAFQGKYYEFNNEVFPIQNLLNKEVCGVSEEYYCKNLKKLIEENQNLSDMKLAERMNGLGIDTSRRTIAKYRNILNLKTKHERVKENEH